MCVCVCVCVVAVGGPDEQLLGPEQSLGQLIPDCLLSLTQHTQETWGSLPLGHRFLVP